MRLAIASLVVLGLAGSASAQMVPPNPIVLVPLPERKCIRFGAERSCTAPGSPEGPYYRSGDKTPPVMANAFCRANGLPTPPHFWAWICGNGSPVLIKITEPAHANCPQLATMFPGMDCVAASCDENEIRGLQCRNPPPAQRG